MQRSFITLSTAVLLCSLFSAATFFHAVSAQSRIFPLGDATVVLDRLSARHFIAPHLEARAALVIDPSDQTILFEKNADKVVPLASLTKIMTALVASEDHDGALSIQVQEKRGAVHWPLTAFLQGMLITSSNNAAQIVMALPTAKTSGQEPPEERFVERMNTKARELGFEHMLFRNATGLDMNEDTAGAYGTAREVAALLWQGTLEQPEIFKATAEEKMTLKSKEGIRSTVVNTNTILSGLPSVRASKTGFTNLAGGNLAVVIDIGIDHPIILVVLGSTENGRFRDIRKLADAALAYYGSDTFTQVRTDFARVQSTP